MGAWSVVTTQRTFVSSESRKRFFFYCTGLYKSDSMADKIDDEDGRVLRSAARAASTAAIEPPVQGVVVDAKEDDGAAAAAIGAADTTPDPNNGTENGDVVTAAAAEAAAQPARHVLEDTPHHTAAHL